ncbi:unnamed protein product [Sphenostylis stenocarpa]|uniref:Uncharacterized protein n=1 Tax=Sphenostylis stenocarpa TaxID=92480 RepID=A0AA86SZ48_9FABA|nr:unnamed protein product [Sphenostylis stenocarpa]
MLELNQIPRANEINFAVLTTLPTFFLTLSLAPTCVGLPHVTLLRSGIFNRAH